MRRIFSEPFGTTHRGEPVRRYVLENDTGMQVKILDYGCTVQSLLVRGVDVVLGYDDLKGYERGSCYFGAFVGRYANRIKEARFRLNGKDYLLEPNDGPNHLHGVYTTQVFAAAVEGDALVFRLRSPDGEEGFPGNLKLEIRYRLTDDNGLEIRYRAATDADTVLNLTNHSYFNLNGQDGSDILGHTLCMDADRFTEGDRETLPTGRILPTQGTAMDFRTEKPIGQDLFADDPQLAMCRGYDHNFILREGNGELRWFARARGEGGGICLDCYTTQPAVQLYTGNYVDEDAAPRGKNGLRYPRYEIGRAHV